MAFLDLVANSGLEVLYCDPLLSLFGLTFFFSASCRKKLQTVFAKDAENWMFFISATHSP